MASLDAMPLTQYYTASTLDGFIAGPDESLEWLFTREQDHDGPLNYKAFIADVGALAMGRTTYDWVLGHASEGWPYDIPCWVFTHRSAADVPEADIRFTSDDVVSVQGEMREAAGGKNLWIVGGGDLVGQFADAGLLDEMIVYVASVTLGSGKPLLPRHV